MNRQDDELAFYLRRKKISPIITNTSSHRTDFGFTVQRKQSEKLGKETPKHFLSSQKKKHTNNKLEQKILLSASDICRGLNYFRFLKGLHFYLNPVRYTVRLLLFPFNINTFEWRLSLFISISSFAHFIVHLATSFQCSFTSFNSGIIETKTKIPVRLNM
jgi:hypothetical protein